MASIIYKLHFLFTSIIKQKMSKRKPDENENLVSKRTSHEPVSDDEDDMNDWLNFAKDVQTINNDDDDDAVLLVET